MADSKVSALTSKATVVSTDEVYIVDNDVPATPASKKAPASNFLGGSPSASKYQLYGRVNDSLRVFSEYTSLGGGIMIGTRAFNQCVVLRQTVAKKIGIAVSQNTVDADETWALEDDLADVKTITITNGLTGTYESTDGDATIAAGSLVNYRNLGIFTTGTLRIAGVTAQMEEAA